MSKGFTTEWKEELKSRSDIVTTISRYIKLDKKGKNYWGLCPFHYEKTPSFCVNEIEQFYKCFGCGESGDVITFVQKYEGVAFPEAISILAKNAGMEVPSLEDNSKLELQKKEKEQVLQALKMAARIYYQLLKSPLGKPAQEYLKKRNVNEKSVVTFGIGYSPDFDTVVKELSKHFSLDTLKKAGLVETSSSGKHFDPFAQRLVFPLINSYGDVIGFSARIIEDKPFAKYKNSSQGLVFDKSRVIFGINLLKKLKKESHSDIPYAILVEGQLDVVSMHQAGFKSTIASLGTALTQFHAQEIKRMTNTVILLLDGDSAGQKATIRSIDILRPTGITVKVATLPEGLDPDEFLKKYGSEKMQELLNKATDATDFQIQTLAKSFDLSDKQSRAKFIKSALNIVANLETDAEKNIYLETVRKLSNVPVDVLRQDLQNVKQESYVEEKEEKFEENFDSDAYILADKFILASLLYHKPWANLKECENLTFLNSDANLLFDYIKKGTPEKPAIVGGVFTIIDVENSPFIKGVINYVFNDEISEKVWKDCINKNKERWLLMEKDKLENTLKSADIDQRKDIAKKMFLLDIEIAKLKIK